MRLFCQKKKLPVRSNSFILRKITQAVSSFTIFLLKEKRKRVSNLRVFSTQYINALGKPQRAQIVFEKYNLILKRNHIQSELFT